MIKICNILYLPSSLLLILIYLKSEKYIVIPNHVLYQLNKRGKTDNWNYLQLDEEVLFTKGGRMI